MATRDPIKKAQSLADKMVKEEYSKAEIAREVFDLLSDHKRKHVIKVFIENIGLTKAGASTYYQSIKNKSK